MKGKRTVSLLLLLLFIAVSYITDKRKVKGYDDLNFDVNLNEIGEHENIYNNGDNINNDHINGNDNTLYNFVEVKESQKKNRNNTDNNGNDISRTNEETNKGKEYKSKHNKTDNNKSSYAGTNRKEKEKGKGKGTTQKSTQKSTQKQKKKTPIETREKVTDEKTTDDIIDTKEEKEEEKEEENEEEISVEVKRKVHKERNTNVKKKEKGNRKDNTEYVSRNNKNKNKSNNNTNNNNNNNRSEHEEYVKENYDDEKESDIINNRDIGEVKREREREREMKGGKNSKNENIDTNVDTNVDTNEHEYEDEDDDEEDDDDYYYGGNNIEVQENEYNSDSPSFQDFNYKGFEESVASNTMKPDAEDYHYDDDSEIEDLTTIWSKNMQNFEPSTLLTFEIGSHSEEFLFEDVDKVDTFFRGVFYSINETDDNIIQLLISDPDGNIIYQKEAAEGIFLFHTKKIGVYTFTLKNTKWVGKKVTTIAIGTGENPSLRSTHIKDFTNYLHQIIAETNRLNNEIKYLTSKHHTHIEKMKKITNRAFIYCFIKLFVLIFLSIFTIYYIKNLVQNKRVL